MSESNEGQDSAAPGASAPGVRAVPTPGETFADRYRIDGLLGRGGMGEVYRAVQSPLGRSVALKILKPPENIEDDPHFEGRFLNEAAAAARLNHPNTITVHDFGQTEDGVLYIVMEYLEGRDVRRALLQDGPFPFERAVHVARQVARSLREAHRKGIVHRDLKPANVLLVQRDDDHDFVKVLDFGLVKFQGQLTEITLAGKFLGSPRYTSPEALDRHATIDRRADIYSLGILIFTMICGKPPFDGDALQILNAHIYEVAPRIRVVHPQAQIPEVLEQIVAKCLEKRPDNRYDSMEELLAALSQVGGEESLSLSLDTDSLLGLGQEAGSRGIQDSDEQAAMRRTVDVPVEITTAKVRQIADPVSDAYERSSETSTILRSLDEAVGNPLIYFLRRPTRSVASLLAMVGLVLALVVAAQVLGPVHGGSSATEEQRLRLEVALNRPDVKVAYRDHGGAWQTLGHLPLEASIDVPASWSAVLLRLTPAGLPSIFVEALVQDGRARWEGDSEALVFDQAAGEGPANGAQPAQPGEEAGDLQSVPPSEGGAGGKASGAQTQAQPGASRSTEAIPAGQRPRTPSKDAPSADSKASKEQASEQGAAEKTESPPSGYKDNPY